MAGLGFEDEEDDARAVFSIDRDDLLEEPGVRFDKDLNFAFKGIEVGDQSFLKLLAIAEEFRKGADQKVSGRFDAKNEVGEGTL